jgi:hypothetical protein
VGILGLSSRGTLDIEEVNIRGKGIIESDRVTKDRKRDFFQHLQLPGLSILYSAQFPIHIMNIYVLRAACWKGRMSETSGVNDAGVSW